MHETASNKRMLLIRALERLRLHMKQIYDESRDDDPILQYVVLLDLSELSFQNIVRLSFNKFHKFNFEREPQDVNLFTWIAKDLTPRFPGMIGAGKFCRYFRRSYDTLLFIISIVFMLNYSWTHSGIWGVIKYVCRQFIVFAFRLISIRRLLPEAALSRIFFPSNKDLIECLTHSALPQGKVRRSLPVYFCADQGPIEFGGSLPSLFDLEDPLRPRQLTPSSPHDRLPSEYLVELATAPHGGSTSRVSSTSALNPFYGYPVTPAPTKGVPTLRFGRRRKRDLVRTLAKLFWLRWHSQVNTLLCLVGIIFLVRLVSRKGLPRLLRGSPLSFLSFFDRPPTI